MKRYVPSAAMAENCDLENHRSKLKVCQQDEKMTEDESEGESLKLEKNRKLEDKEGRKADRSKETKKELCKADLTEEGNIKDILREEKTRISDKEKNTIVEPQLSYRNIGKEQKKLDEKSEKVKRLENLNKDVKKVDEKVGRSRKMENGKDASNNFERSSKHGRAERTSDSRRDGKQKFKETEGKPKPERSAENIIIHHSSEVLEQNQPIFLSTENASSYCEISENKKPCSSFEVVNNQTLSPSEDNFSDSIDKKDQKYKRDDPKFRNSKEPQKEKSRDCESKSDHSHRENDRFKKAHDLKHTSKSFKEERTKLDNKRKLSSEEHSSRAEAKKQRNDQQPQERSATIKSVDQSLIGTRMF